MSPNSRARESTPRVPDVSVVIPAYGVPATTRRCLESLWGAVPRCSFEVIVVDNGTVPPLVASLGGLRGEFRVVRNETNLGFARACNQGAAQARGRHILFLNNDTEARPGWLDPLVESLDADPSAGLAGSRLLFPDGRIQHAGVALCRERSGRPSVAPYHIYSGDPGASPHAAHPRTLNAVTGASLLVRRDLFEMLGGFDEGFWNGCEDVDLCFRAREAGFRVLYVPHSTLVHFESAGGAERYSRYRENLELFESRWGLRFPPDDHQLCLEDGCLAAWVQSQHGPWRTSVPLPLTSVLVIAAGAPPARLARCLEAVFSPTRLPVEVLLAGAPVPGELAARPVDADPDRGYAHLVNRSVRAARGDMFLVLDANLVPGERGIEALMGALMELPDSAISGYAAPEGIAGPLDPACLLTRRDVQERLGEWCEELGPVTAAQDFCLRATAAGWRLSVAPGQPEEPPRLRTAEKPGHAASFEMRWGAPAASCFPPGAPRRVALPAEPEIGDPRVRGALAKARALAAAGQLDVATGLVEEALSLDPSEVEALLERGSLHWQEGDMEAAEREFQLATKSAPHSARALAHLASFLRVNARLGPAIDAHQKLLQLRPRDADVLASMAECLLDAGAADMAEKCLGLVEAFVRNHPAVPGLKTRLAGLGDPSEVTRAS